MNFVGHAAFAHRRGGDDAFVLGAMLPDFATMIGARIDGIEHGALRAGVEFHHRTDDVFHGHPEFRSLCAGARSAMMGAGVRRPSALAAAHIGVEFLLDGHYWPQTADAFRGALRRASLAGLGAAITWRDDGAPQRFEALRSRLLDGNGPGHGEPHTVARRIVYALRARPRLAVPTDQTPLLAAWAKDAAPTVQAAVPALDRDLERVLAP